MTTYKSEGQYRQYSIAGGSSFRLMIPLHEIEEENSLEGKSNEGDKDKRLSVVNESQNADKS